MRDEVDDFESLYIHSDDVPTTRVEKTVRAPKRRAKEADVY